MASTWYRENVARLRMGHAAAAFLVAVLALPAATVAGSGDTATVTPIDTACDTVAAAVGDTPGVAIRRDREPFEAGPAGATLRGCRVLLTGSFAALAGTPHAADRLRTALAAAGWQDLPRHAADGKDGTRFAFARGAMRCFVVGWWNGGSDGEPPVPGADRYDVSVGCTDTARALNE